MLSTGQTNLSVLRVRRKRIAAAMPIARVGESTGTRKFFHR